MNVVKRSDPLIDVWDLPTFPTSYCAAPVKEDSICHLWFIETPCMRVFNEESISMMGRYLRGSHIWTCIVTVVCGLFALRRLRGLPVQSGRPFAYGGSLIAITSMYSIVTGALALVRYFLNISRLFHLCVILHNLAECMIMAHFMTFKDSSNRQNPEYTLLKRLTYVFCWNLFVIAFQFLVPSFAASYYWTRPFDTLMDLALPFSFVPKALYSENPEVRDFYKLPAIATMVHLLCAIVPVSFAILFSQHASWFTDFFLEAVINLSIPLTHILWCYWAMKFQGKVWHWSDTKGWEYLIHVGGSPEKSSQLSEADSKKATEWEVDNPWRKIAPAFIIGWFGGWLVPILLGECSQLPHHCHFFNQKATASTTFKAKNGFNFELEKHLLELRSLAEESPGNLLFQVNKKVNNNLKFNIYEAWEKVDDLKKFRKSINYESLLSSDAFTKILDNKKGLEQIGIFVEEMPPECRSKGLGSVLFEVPQSCDDVEHSIEYFNLCLGVPNCLRSFYSGSIDLEGHIFFELDDGRTIAGLKYNALREGTTVYEVTQSEDALSGYTGTISKQPGESKKSCIINYQFTIPLGRDNIPASKIQRDFEGDLPRYKRMLVKDLPKSQSKFISSRSYRDEF